MNDNNRISTTSKLKRIGSLDFLRSYGCLAIILLHVVSAWHDDPANKEALFNADPVRISFDGAIVPLLVRMAVPIFFMISGALFLDPKRNVNIKKHIIKILLTLGVFGYGMALIELVVKYRDFNISYLWNSLLNLLQEQSWSHLWYLYAIIGLYLLTPILRAWIQNASEREIRDTIIIAVVLLSIIPTINSVANTSITTFGITTSSGALLCYLIGFYIFSSREKIRSNKTKVIVAAAMGGVATSIASLLYFKSSRSMVEPYHIWIVVYSSSLFALMIEERSIEMIGNSKVIQFLSSISLLVYILHPIFINALYKGLHIYPDVLPPIIGELAFWVAASLFAIVLGWITGRIPVVKKILQ